MAFTAANNGVFQERAKRLMAALYEVAFTEGDKLDAIYTNEAVSGDEAAWEGTEIATAAECVEVIVLIRALKAFITTGGHLVRITPFIQ